MISLFARMYIDALAASIRKKRIQKKLTQERLSGLANISNRQYVRIEMGKCKPDMLSVFKIAVALDIHYSELMDASFKQFKKNAKDYL